jgi:uncharacterized protein YndB with AHSA1/START domain
MPHSFTQIITIHAPAQLVWDSLTQPELMAQWMGERDMDIQVETDWVIGNPIVVRGFHHARFESKGRILAFKPTEQLTYTHLSSLSRLPDAPENHTTLDFRLSPEGKATCLTFVASSFPTDSIFKHLQFYWGGTLEILKRHIEQRLSDQTGGSVQGAC